MIRLKIFMILMFLLTLLSCNSLQNSLKKENEFNITLGSCFDNDTVSVYVNDTLLFDNRVFKSGFSTGIVPNTYIKYEDGYLIAEHENEQKRVKSQINDHLRIKVYKNDTDSTLTLSLRKGRNMVIDACQSEITVNQYKKSVTFE